MTVTELRKEKTGPDMTSFRVNLDYERCLFDPQYRQTLTSTSAINRIFEYIYFFMEDSNTPLASDVEYAADYLEYLESLGLPPPKIVKPDGNSQNWWGKLQNIELEKTLNSKLTSTQMAIDHKWCHPLTRVIENLNALSETVAKNPAVSMWMLKHPFGMSGAGNLVIRKDEINDENHQAKVEGLFESSALILEPYLDRVLDFGFTVLPTDVSFLVENLNTGTGAFKGGVIADSKEQQRYLFEEKKIDLTSYFSIMDGIKAEYRKLGAADYPLQFDSYYYLSEGRMFLYPLVEANCRRTMGGLLYRLKRFLPENGWGACLILNELKAAKNQSFGQKLKKLGKHLYNHETKVGIIPISPMGGRFQAYFLACEHRHGLLPVLECLSSILGQEFASIPRKFQKFL